MKNSLPEKISLKGSWVSIKRRFALRRPIEVVPGLGRQLLARSEEKFGLILIDAFTSDSIPAHLLTREALRVYRDRLRPDGLIAIHISNRYLDLEPVVAALAAEADPPMICLTWQDTIGDPAEGRFA